MTHQEICDLIACFDRSGVTALKLSMEAFSIELTKPEVACAPAAASRAAETATPETAVKAAKAAVEAVHQVTAPMVGTFYAAPAPDQPPFVTVGQQVRKGETLCLMEAMKMMSEVTAPCDCVIEAVLKENGEMAAFGDGLFIYRPC